MDEYSSHRDKLSSDSDEGEVGSQPTHTTAEAGQKAPADSVKKDETADDAEAGHRLPAESGMRQTHVVETDPKK